MSLKIKDFTGLRAGRNERITLTGPGVENLDVPGDTADSRDDVRFETRKMSRHERIIRNVNRALPFLFSSKITRPRLEQDHIAMTAFIKALKDRYDENAARFAAQSVLGIDDTLDFKTSAHKVRSLTARKIDRMIEAAKTFHGHGEAKKLQRHAVLRFWPAKKRSTTHPGHASMTTKKGIGHQQCHISWWPSGGISGKDGTWKPIDGNISATYHQDKGSEISPLTAQKLNSGEYRPQPRQRRQPVIKGARLTEEMYHNLNLCQWGVSAEKVYLPMLGRAYPKDGGRVRNFIFGLDDVSIEASWEKVKNGIDDKSEQYQMVSKTRNCSGMVGRMLEAGGATMFMKLPKNFLYSDPNTMKDYALNLEEIMAAYNGDAETFLDARDKLYQDRLAPYPMDTGNPTPLTTIQERFSQQLQQTRLTSNRNAYGKLAKAMENAGLGGTGVERMRHCKDIVDALKEVMGGAPQEKINRQDEPKVKAQLQLDCLALDVLHRLAQEAWNHKTDVVTEDAETADKKDASAEDMARKLRDGGAGVFLEQPEQELYASVTSMADTSRRLKDAIDSYNRKNNAFMELREVMYQGELVLDPLAMVGLDSLDTVRGRFAEHLENADLETNHEGYDRLGRAVAQVTDASGLERMRHCKNIIDALTVVMGENPDNKLARYGEPDIEKQLELDGLALDVLYRLGSGGGSGEELFPTN